MKIPATLFLAVTTTLLAACASGGGAMEYPPFALFEPYQSLVPSDTRGAFVLEIDGEKQTIERNNPVRPGVHKLLVSVPTSFGNGGSRRETMTIDVKPCVRYYLAAKRSMESTREWNAFIHSTEPISGCRAGA
jgi:hypothetical protein